MDGATGKLEEQELIGMRTSPTFESSCPNQYPQNAPSVWLGGGDESCVFIARTDVEAETPILWPPDSKSKLIGKDPDTGKD